MQDLSYSHALPIASTKGCVYLAVCTVNGKGYIGKSILGLRYRRRHHVSKAAVANSLMGRALKKHGEENFVWQELFISQDDKALHLAEVELIAAYKNAGFVLYNMTSGGEGTAGIVRSAETRKRARDSRLSRLASEKAGVATPYIHTEERKRLIGERSRKHWAEPKSRAIHSQAAKKLWADPEYRAKMSRVVQVRRAAKLGLRYNPYRKPGAYHPLTQ